MCQFLSALVLRNGDVLTHPMLDSHSDLVTYFGLPDGRMHHQHFAKVELVPTEETWLTPAAWTWRLDEETAPGWWDDVAGAAEAALRARAEAMILRADRALIAEGVWIVPTGVTVTRLIGGRIARLMGAVHDVWGGTVQAVRAGGTVQAVRAGGTVQAVRAGGTVHDVRGGGTVIRRH